MKNSSPHILIIGGVAAGASAAARARRLSESAHITVIERGPDVSFANCGLPYHIGGEIVDRAKLALQTPESLSSLLNIHVRASTEAIAINRAAKTVTIRSLSSGTTETLSYDKLILAPGARPLRPPLPGIDSPRVLTLRNLQDMDRIKAEAAAQNSFLIIGAGFIGLEMAEQLRHLGKQISLVEMADQVLPQLDPEIAAPIADELRDHGIDLYLGDGLVSFAEENNRLTATLHSGQKISADRVILSIGVAADSALAKEADLALGERGTIAVNEWMQTSDPDIYAAGDAVQSFDRISGSPMNLALGGPANRQGRLIADHIFHPEKARPYAGHVGTAIVRVFDVAAGGTGWSEKRLQRANIPYSTSLITDYHHASYFPGATLLTVKLLWEKETGRLLGAQAVGPQGVDKRLDVLATALTGKLTVEDLAQLELSYAPPFGSARDVVNTAAFAALNQRDGLVRTVTTLPPERRVLDVRATVQAALNPVPGALNIPLPELRARLGEIDRATAWVTLCNVGKSSYFAARILTQHGYDVVSLSGGSRLNLAPPTKKLPPSVGAPAKEIPIAPTNAAEEISLDCTGLSCPGPLLQVKARSETLLPGQILQVTASDGGFARDIAAFAQSNGFTLLAVNKSASGVVARLQKPASSAPVAPAISCSPDGRRKGATIVVFSGEMDKVMATLVIANGAAAMGGKVTLFFTFWGINALRREHAVSTAPKGILDKMFGWMLPRGLGKLPLSKMNFGGAGRAMMNYQMRSKNLPNLPGLLGAAKLAGIRLVVCSMSMEAMGILPEELIDGVEFGGVADYLNQSEQSGTNLFV